MSLSHVFAPKEEAERAGFVPKQAVNVYAFANYNLQGVEWIPFYSHS